MWNFNTFGNGETILQVNEWLSFLAWCVAFCVVITWPVVKGKWCLVVSLSLILLPEALSHLLPYLIDPSNIDEAGRIMMGPEEYQDFWIYSMIVMYLSVFGKFLFVVGVFQLRSELRKLRVLFSTESEAR